MSNSRPLSLALARSERPYSGEHVLYYYDGPLLFWLPHPELKLLAVALPEEAGPWPFLVASVGAEQAQALLFNKLTLQRTVLTSQANFLMADYGAETLELIPLDVVPPQWLPGDVCLTRDEVLPD